MVADCDHLSNLKLSRTLPYAFSEHGAIMAASVLNTPRAVEASIFVVRAFVKLRQMVAAHKDLARKLAALEKKYDDQFKIVFEAIAELMTPLSVLAADVRRWTQTVLSRRCHWTKSTLRLSAYATG